MQAKLCATAKMNLSIKPPLTHQTTSANATANTIKREANAVASIAARCTWPCIQNKNELPRTLRDRLNLCIMQTLAKKLSN